ncbi:MAG TPA: hypothetical protein H9955_11550 [Candidatus Mediterraneibacter cottocaccae]|nr:hypothetical protein [Candidatus Mediterraneibacter cottocaccae]
MEKEIYHAKTAPEYQEPFIDIDEDRERILPDGSKVGYRYMHGGFKNTGVKFSYCFPKKENYTGRFFHYLSPFPGPDEELASLEKTGVNDRIAFALVNGAYYVESNMGSTSMFGAKENPQEVWQSSAAVAEYSRVKAMEIYGCGRPYGYVHGGSGGGYKTMACIENTDAWDGAVPFVIGSPVSLPNTIMMHAQGQRCLRRVFGQIADAVDAGGSGDMYAGLTEDEAFMLREITNMGFPPRTWYLEAAGKIDDGALPVLAPLVEVQDPEYFTDFWTVPGYLGADPKSSAVKDRLQFHGIVKSVHVPGTPVDADSTMEAAALESGAEVGEASSHVDGRNGVDDAWKKMLADGNGAWIELEEVPQGDDLYLKGVNICFESGEAKGMKLLLDQIRGNYLTIGMCYGMEDLPGVLSKVKPGDQVFLDNSNYIAIQSYYRHQVPADLSFHAWDQFRDENGKPTLPQRKQVLGYDMSGTGTVQDGNIQGKVIILQALMDESTCPWCGDWYYNKIRETKGTDSEARLYYMDRCLHGDDSALENNMTVDYTGALSQALLDMSDWVERGIEPLPSTVYHREGGQIIPAPSAGERKGIQPVITFLANGTECARVKPGETVHFTVRVEVPQGAGAVTKVLYDTEEVSVFPAEGVFRNEAAFRSYEKEGLQCAEAEFTAVYEKPGTYMASVQVRANRKGDASDIYTQVKNLARARVIVG